MFEQIFAQEEEDNSKEIKTQMNFTREQAILQSSLEASDDQVHMQEQDRRSDLIRWQQELEPEMYDLILTLLGFDRDAEGKVKKVKEPMCNKLFIYEVIKPMLKPFMSKNLINSNYDERQILNIQKRTANDLASAMSDGYDKYGIEFTNYDIILRKFKNIMSPTIWRAYKGWTKKTDSSTIKRVENEVSNLNEESKKSPLSIFGG